LFRQNEKALPSKRESFVVKTRKLCR